MYGQMTAGSWIYIGRRRDFVRGRTRLFAAAAKKHFGGDLAGKLVGKRRNGRQWAGRSRWPRRMNGAAFLGIDADPERIKRRVKAGYCDVMVTSLDEALRILKNAVRKREATSVGGSVGNCADLIPELAKRACSLHLLTESRFAFAHRVSSESAAPHRDWYTITSQ